MVLKAKKKIFNFAFVFYLSLKWAIFYQYLSSKKVLQLLFIELLNQSIYLSIQDVIERVDCRHLDICSVDPPGCTDIDDALHARLLPNGNYEV